MRHCLLVILTALLQHARDRDFIDDTVAFRLLDCAWARVDIERAAAAAPRCTDARHSRELDACSGDSTITQRLNCGEALQIEGILQGEALREVLAQFSRKSRVAQKDLCRCTQIELQCVAAEELDLFLHTGRYAKPAPPLGID